jgi:hypothetical protein
MSTDTSNINFQLAADFIQYTNRSVFLTGKAGTGKTTFLKYIKQHSNKQIAVVAPTGVAAINAGGATIHSFFQLPFTPFLPEKKGFGPDDSINDKNSLLGRIRLNTERRKVLQQLELLIIDEISMVRCDVLDAIDTVLKSIRKRNHEPFGGVQVLLIGDMYQLPPVVQDAEWKILSQSYNSPYFFDSRIIEAQAPAYIELNKIYRQSDEKFIEILNQVRNNEMTEGGLKILHSRYSPSFTASKEEGYIHLTTHNHKADSTNTNELVKLKGDLFSFKAIIDGDFSEKAFPADETLQLKIGAQVMFIKNDLDKAKRYYNGKIGIVERLEDDSIFVQCKNESETIEVKKDIWKNIRYSVNKQTQQLEEQEIGSFTQYPLRLAWSITIHKSQGLTFEKAIIDAGQAFAPGQVYVALSRCTSLEGIVLMSKITPESLHTDQRIIHFSKNSSAADLPENLHADKHRYQTSILLRLFIFSDAIEICKNILAGLDDHLDSFNKETKPWMQQVEEKIYSLHVVGEKFQSQLHFFFQQNILPEQNVQLQERIKKACSYFDDQIQLILAFLNSSPAITDSKQYAMAYNEDLKELFILLAQQKNLIHSCKDGFNVSVYHEQKNNFVLPSFTVNAYAGSVYKKSDSPHPILHRELRLLRDKICNDAHVPIYIVAGTITLDEMAMYLPQSLDELEKINGFGKAKIKKFGQEFLDVILRYSKVYGLSSGIKDKVPKKETKQKSIANKKSKIDTKQQSFDLYKDGKSVNEIAAERGLTPQTIESHLAYYVSIGEIKIEALVSEEKTMLIESALGKFESLGISSLKNNLGDAVSFSEIKFVLAAKEFEKTKPQI